MLVGLRDIKTLVENHGKHVVVYGGFNIQLIYIRGLIWTPIYYNPQSISLGMHTSQVLIFPIVLEDAKF